MSTLTPLPKRESWLGCFTIAISLLGLSLCICLALVFTAADLVPSQLDRYVNLEPGQASLYRVTYAGGSQGFLSQNVVRPDTDAIPYARLQGEGGQAVQIQSIFTNWQGSGQTITSKDFYARGRSQLLLIARHLQGNVNLFQPAISIWADDLFAQPLSNETTLNGNALSYRLSRQGEETVTLPNGEAVSAVIVLIEWRFQDQLYDQTLSWFVRDVGLVRSEESDGQGNLIQQLELLNSTRLSGAAAPPILQSSSSVAVFREDLARTGAHPAVILPNADFKIVYRLKAEQPFTASATVADGLLFAADQSGVLTAYEAGQGAPRWQFTAGGALVAAPAVANGIVYIGASDKTLYALETQHGLYLWSRRFGDNVATSPVIADGVLFLGVEDRTFHALDATTGETLWSFTAGDRIVSSPALSGDLIFFGSDDSILYALNRISGEARWRFSLDSPVAAAPAVSADGIVYAGSTGGRFVAVEAATGNELWSIETRFGFAASPVVGEQLVFVADDGGEVRALNRRSGEMVWEWRNVAPSIVGSPLLLGNRLLVPDYDGMLHIIEADTGQVRQTLKLGADVSASPTWDGERIYLTTQDSEIFALQPTAEAASLLLNLLWEKELNDVNEFNAPSADPVYADGKLYALLHEGDLVAIEMETQKSNRLLQLGETVDGPAPVVHGGNLYLVTDKGKVVAFDLNTRQAIWQVRVGGQFNFGPAVDGEHVYVQSAGVNSQVTALDAVTGQTVWTQPIENGAGFVALTEETLFATGRNIYALDRATGEEKWRSEPFLSLGSLAVYDGVLYAGGSDGETVTLIALNATTGKTLWKQDDPVLFFKNRPSYDPATHTIFIGAKDGKLYAYNAEDGALRWRFQADAAIQSNTHLQEGVVYFTTFSGTTYAVDAQTGSLHSNFRPGTAVNTFVGPVVLPGLVFAVNGTTLYALAVER
ncbi:MAG: PQQ-binding-like beta-propeller repeat protein [Chloroflexi bacterium]|nr:PQQ-binding-like beta-propeller repeat protein [Chloroflexota bacterium]